MFLTCEKCQAKFLPNRGFVHSACPRCGTKQETERAILDVKGAGPLRLVVRNHAPWLPRWVGALGGSFFFFVTFGSVAGHEGLGWLVGTIQFVLIASWLLWRFSRRTTVIEVGSGRIASETRLAPWPGRWLPASAIERLSARPAEERGGRHCIDAHLRGGARVTLMENVAPQLAEAVMQRLSEKLAEPAPGVPELDVQLGEREAHLGWTCGRSVRLDIARDTIRARVGTRAVELDTDDVQSVLVQEQPPQKKLVRYRLVVVLKKRAPQVLVDDELVREPLDLAAREIQRVLRLALLG